MLMQCCDKSMIEFHLFQNEYEISENFLSHLWTLENSLAENIEY